VILLVHNDPSMDAGLANGVEDCVQAIFWRASVNAWIALVQREIYSTEERLKSFTNGEVEIFIHTILDQRDHIDGFKSD
jgi:hypothetical protein